MHTPRSNTCTWGWFSEVSSPPVYADEHDLPRLRAQLFAASCDSRRWWSASHGSSCRTVCRACGSSAVYEERPRNRLAQYRWLINTDRSDSGRLRHKLLVEHCSGAQGKLD